MTETAAHAALPAARRAMIDSQLRPCGVNEPWVLAAMAALPREDFLPADLAAHAYIDRALPLGGDLYLASPVVQAQMLATAEPTAQDKALVVGTGNGYLPALLAQMAGAVETIKAGEAPAGSGYTLILIDGAIEVLPEALVAVLAEGGRVVTGLLDRGVSRLALGRKAGGQVALTALCDLPIPALAAFARPKQWSF